MSSTSPTITKHGDGISVQVTTAIIRQSSTTSFHQSISKGSSPHTTQQMETSTTSSSHISEASLIRQPSSLRTSKSTQTTSVSRLEESSFISYHGDEPTGGQWWTIPHSDVHSASYPTDMPTTINSSAAASPPTDNPPEPLTVSHRDSTKHTQPDRSNISDISKQLAANKENDSAISDDHKNVVIGCSIFGAISAAILIAMAIYWKFGKQRWVHNVLIMFKKHVSLKYSLLPLQL